MKYTKLGNTDIKVSKICVGGMSFGEVKEGGINGRWIKS